MPKIIKSFFQKPRARMSSISSLERFVVHLLKSLPLNYRNFGLIFALLHTSDRIFLP